MNLILAILASLITAFLLFRVFFETLDELIDCIKFWFTPDIISWLRGQSTEDWWAELKIIVWLATVSYTHLTLPTKRIV